MVDIAQNGPGRQPARRIDDIHIGERHRRDMGDIAGLATSIAEIGLLNPITVDGDGQLLAGARRLAACKMLGWKEIPVNVVRCGDAQ
jgi:ParB family transcriptional regulator, chromosome partitioning protein